ncbi:MAG TPA: hypothetical protein VHO69_08410 [Phototrophicaceae bacterium]|nr:hypothetical protein [Phototrophicaceae bacterium]
MVVDWAGVVGLIGPISLVVALVVIGLLSKRLGRVLRTRQYYVGFFIAAGLMATSVFARILNLGRGAPVAAELNHDPAWVFLYMGLPAIALTLGIVVAWRYWSWLLAERS